MHAFCLQDRRHQVLKLDDVREVKATRGRPKFHFIITTDKKEFILRAETEVCC